MLSAWFWYYQATGPKKSWVEGATGAAFDLSRGSTLRGAEVSPYVWFLHMYFLAKATVLGFFFNCQFSSLLFNYVIK
jgi:hypothetical protein